MANCCNARGCDRFFNPRLARRAARRYRKRGPDRTACKIVEHLAGRGVDGLTVLEIGGGIGEIGLELLKRGARSAVTLELSPAYDAHAEQLIREAGLEQRATRILGDIAVDPQIVEPADVVVLHRVVCCYPDYERLLSAAADRARQALVFSHPPRNAVSRLVASAQNVALRLRRSAFRVFTHRPASMVAVLERDGLRRSSTHSGFVWRVVALERSA